MLEIYKNLTSASINNTEIEKFARIAEEWWNPKGKFRPLHKFNPARLEFILNIIAQNLSLNLNEELPLRGLKILDIGCGGGLLCEPLARLGATIVGIDAAAKNIVVARMHAEQVKLSIDYRAITLEDLSASGEIFDVVLNMEVVEHVENLDGFMQCCFATVKPGGLLFVSTLNRTLKAWTFAIVAAEYILNWLPKGTHNIKKFITPAELKAYFHKDEFGFVGQSGIVYNLLHDNWQLSPDMSINYVLAAKKNL